MSLIDTHNQGPNLKLISPAVVMTPRKIQKQDEAEVVDMLRKTISPMEIAGSSLVTTHRVLKGLYDFYSRPSNSYFILANGDQKVILGIGVSTFAGLPMEERVAEMRDFIYQNDTSIDLCEHFLRQAIAMAKKMGYEKLYVKIQTDFERLKLLYRKLGFNPVEDQSLKENIHVKKDLLFRRL